MSVWTHSADRIGGFWGDPAVWVLMVPVTSGLEKNYDPPPRIAETPSAFFVDYQIFVFPGELIYSTLLVMVLKFWRGSHRVNWKKNGSWKMRSTFWFGSILQPKRKIVIPGGLSSKISDGSFITFPKACINYEAERLSTPYALFITFIICYAYSNAKYVSIGNPLSTSVIKSDTVWQSLREPTEEVSRSKPAFFFTNRVFVYSNVEYF